QTIVVCWTLTAPALCAALSGHRNANFILFCQYVDRGQESNINNVIHAHTRRGNGQLKSVCDDPRDPCGRNAREFGNIPDHGTENAPKAVAATTTNGPAYIATNFTAGNDRSLTPAQSWQPYLDGAISCKDRAVITCAPEGISYASLDSDATRWSLP